MRPLFYDMSRIKNILAAIRNTSWPILAGDTRAKFFFLLLSVFLWFLIKLSKEGYTTEMSFPVVYQDLPADKRLINVPPKELTLSLGGQGFDLLRSRLRSLQPLEISVQNLQRIDSTTYRWNTTNNLDAVVSELGDNIDILSIFPEEVPFEFTPLRSKRVKVYLNGKREFENFKALYREPQILPDSITITGKPDVVADIDSIFTEQVVLMAEADSVRFDVGLQKPEAGDILISHDEAQVKIRYTSLTEDIINVPVEVINLPENYKLTIFPDKVGVRYQVPIEDYERVDTADFQAYVDYRNLQQGGQQFLRVKLKTLPSYLHKVNLEPSRVEYILSEK